MVWVATHPALRAWSPTRPPSACGRGRQGARERGQAHRRHGRGAGRRPGRQRPQEPADDVRRAVLEVVEGRDVAGVRHLDERRVRERGRHVLGVGHRRRLVELSVQDEHGHRRPRPASGERRRPELGARPVEAAPHELALDNGPEPDALRERREDVRRQVPDGGREGPPARGGRVALRPDRRVIVARHGQVVAGRVRARAASREVERRVLGRQPEHRRAIPAAEGGQRAGEVAKDGVRVGRVVDQLAELDRPQPHMPAHAVGVRPGSDDRVPREPPASPRIDPRIPGHRPARWHTARQAARSAVDDSRSKGSNELSKAASTTTARVRPGWRTANT